MSSIKCFDLSSQVYTVQALSGSNFFHLMESHTFSCLFLNQNHELGRCHSHQIDLCHQGLHSCVWGAVRKNIISNRFSTKAAISAYIQLSLHAFSYLCAHLSISVQR